MGFNINRLSNQNKHAIVVGILFLLVIASEIVSTIQRQKRMRAHAIPTTADVAAYASGDDGSGTSTTTTTMSDHNLFTSMEGEFQWNRFMIPPEQKDSPKENYGSSPVATQDRNTARALLLRANGNLHGPPTAPDGNRNRNIRR